MRNLFLSSVTLLMVPTVSMAAPKFYFNIYTNTPFELKPISQIEKAYKTAAICFLGHGDCSKGGFSFVGSENYKVDTASQCRNEGYTITECSLPTYPAEQCPYNNVFFAKCTEDKARACNESGYTETSCPNGYITAKTCPYASSYITCKINPCSGFSVCGCGADLGASTCYSGSTLKYSSCKNCNTYEVWYACDNGERIYDYTTSISENICTPELHNYMYYPRCNGYGYKYDVGCK